MARLAILGAGMMGSALAVPLVDRGHELRLIGTALDDELIAALKNGADHPTLRYPLPAATSSAIFFASELRAALSGVEAVALGVSSAGSALGRSGSRAASASRHTAANGLEGVGLGRRAFSDPAGCLEANATRGAANRSGRSRRPVHRGRASSPRRNLRHLRRSQPSELRSWAELAGGAYYRVFSSADVVGTEVCAALKNAYAMGIGFVAGLHEKNGGIPGSIALHNCEAALYAQAIREAEAFVVPAQKVAAHQHRVRASVRGRLERHLQRRPNRPFWPVFGARAEPHRRHRRHERRHAGVLGDLGNAARGAPRAAGSRPAGQARSAALGSHARSRARRSAGSDPVSALLQGSSPTVKWSE